MKDFEGMKKQLLSSDNAEELKRFAKTPEAEKLSRSIDGSALKKAAAAGDSETLGRMLKQILSTPEGQSLARKVDEAFGGKQGRS